MNIIFLTLLTSLISCSEPEQPIVNEISYANSFSIPLGGNTYQISGQEIGGIDQNGITSWTSDQTVFGIFFKSSGAENIGLNLNLEPQEGNAEIEVSIGDQTHKIQLSAGASGFVKVGNFKITEGYTAVELKALTKTGANFAKIKSINIEHNGDINAHYVKDNEDNNFYWGRRGPSVHLGYTAPENQNIKWFYNEMTIPEGEDPIGSYFMANGFAEGYFGIQVNSATERRVLFSVWSPYVTDNPNEIPEDERIIVLKKGADVYIGEFGNEGSGGQSYLVYNWSAGTTYKFLNSVEPDGKGNTIYTGYFYAPEVGEWQIISRFKRPKTNTWYKRPHSFLENFNTRTGHIGRKVLYDNQWVRNIEGEWTELTEARFTGDPIASSGFRMDYAGGSKDGKFYLQNCGFFTPHTPLRSMHLRSPNNQTPVIDFDALEKLGVEITAPETITELDKSTWEIVEFSSEETSGEGATGRAKDIIDGKIDTYWHSQWTGTAAEYPHFLTIDFKATTEVKGFVIHQRNGSRKIKDYKIYGSNDLISWSPIFSGTLLNSASQQIITLSEALSIKYLKFEAINAHDGDKFAALAEIGAF